MSKPDGKSEFRYEPDTILNDAATKGDIDTVKRILEDDLSHKIDPKRTRTPLHYAAMYGRRDIAKLLLEHGEPVNARTRQGWTPLLFASADGRTSVMKTLLDAGADIDTQTSLTKALNNALYTPLHIVAALDKCDALHLLIARGASVSRTAADGTRALHIAVKYGRRLNTLILCAFGSDPHAADSNGETAFDYANKLRQPLSDEIRDIMKKWSFQEENLSWVRRNLTKFVNDDGKINVRSLLAYASDSTDELSLVYAIEVGGAKFVNWRDSAGRTAIHNAAFRGNHQGVELLLKKGANVDCRSRNRQWTALLMAVDAGREKTVRTLIQHGADPEAKTDQGENAIFLAKKWNYNQIVELLESTTKSPGPKVPPNRSPVRGRSPNSFRMIREDGETFTPPTAQAVRRVRIVRSPKLEESGEGSGRSRSAPSESEKAKADIDHNPDTKPTFEGGFDGGFLLHSIPDSDLVQPKTFSELAKTWDGYFNFKRKDKIIRITVLDTGIDLDHEDWRRPRAVTFKHGQPISASSAEPSQIDRIKNMMNFCGGSETDIQDLDGHGTQVAGIILRLAPRAEIDIARVCIGDKSRGTTEGEKTGGSNVEKCPQPAAVAKAIDWAIEKGADIINMSFGYKKAPMLIREALKRAQQNNVVVFAAMLNGGSFDPETWPAREEACAIGIHSCNNDGEKAGFNRISNTSDNFMVVGDNVPTHWPKAKGSGFRLDSGTSFAAPVAAAMAALILAFIEQVICKKIREDAQQRVKVEELYGNNGMIRVLRCISVPASEPGFHLIDPQLFWRRFEPGESDSSKHAWRIIERALTP